MSNYSPRRPYFLRAAHEWLSDNDLTPYLVVNANHPELVAPTEYAQNGTLTLSISYQATHNLLIDNEFLSFSARFGGVSQELWIPMASVLAIFAKEDTEQMFTFDPSEYVNLPATPTKSPNQGSQQSDAKPAQNKTPSKKPSLKIIK